MGLWSRWLRRKLGRASFPLHKDRSKAKLRHGLSLVKVCRCLRVKTLELTGRRGCGWGMGQCCNGNSRAAKTYRRTRIVPATAGERGVASNGS